eukprot:m.295431 g.295431  ORF g.295431 m.295431 type:complete len:114 (+) comp27176_c2_seq8:1453-1794(+)
MKRVVKNILQCRTVLVSTWIFFGSTIVTSKPTQPRSIPKVTDCRHRANQPRARASTMMGGSRQLLVAILAVAAIDRTYCYPCRHRVPGAAIESGDVTVQGRTCNLARVLLALG